MFCIFFYNIHNRCTISIFKKLYYDISITFIVIMYIEYFFYVIIVVNFVISFCILIIIISSIFKKEIQMEKTVFILFISIYCMKKFCFLMRNFDWCDCKSSHSNLRCFIKFRIYSKKTIVINVIFKVHFIKMTIIPSKNATSLILF